MAKFLNTKDLNTWIPRLINESRRELVILAPYIQTSKKLLKTLIEADKRGVETLIIYREEKLPQKEKEKLLAISNLNLMHHPNLHAKCYISEDFLIIGSMNMYEYSEKNNREMGILLHRIEIEENNGLGEITDFPELFEDTVKEIRDIINGSEMERPSSETEELGFEFDILKSEEEICFEQCNRINKSFIHKKFIPIKRRKDFFPFCKNYFDHLDLTISHRCEFQFQYPENRIEDIYRKFKPHYDEFLIQNFKLYWNSPSEPIYLYTNYKSKSWSENNSREDNHKLYKNGFDELIGFLKQFI